MESFRTTNLLLLLTLCIITGCNFNQRSNQGGETQQSTDLLLESGEETECSNTDAFGTINEDILWDIFFKIPEEDFAKNLFKTKHDRRQARLNTEVFVNNENENHLLYYEIDNYGAMNGNVMGIACYPTDDSKKIIALFYEERFDIGESQTNQTYEYDIASGTLKPIECPIEPYTEDEFFDKSILTSEQFDEVRKFFPEKKYFIYADVEKNRFSMRFSAHDVFEDWDEFKEYNKYAKRNWNGKRFVKIENSNTTEQVPQVER